MLFFIDSKEFLFLIAAMFLKLCDNVAKIRHNNNKDNVMNLVKNIVTKKWRDQFELYNVFFGYKSGVWPRRFAVFNQLATKKGDDHC